MLAGELYNGSRADCCSDACTSSLFEAENTETRLLEIEEKIPNVGQEHHSNLRQRPECAPTRVSHGTEADGPCRLLGTERPRRRDQALLCHRCGQQSMRLAMAWRVGRSPLSQRTTVSAICRDCHAWYAARARQEALYRAPVPSPYRSLRPGWAARHLLSLNPVFSRRSRPAVGVPRKVCLYQAFSEDLWHQLIPNWTLE